MTRLGSLDRRRIVRLLTPVIRRALWHPRSLLLCGGPAAGWLIARQWIGAVGIVVGLVITKLLGIALIARELFATPGVGPRLAERLGMRFIPAQRHYSYRSPRVGRLVERAQAGHRHRALAGLERLAEDPHGRRIERRDAALARAEISQWSLSTPPAASTRFDVVMVSDFGLAGGTTTSNLAEIEAKKAAALRTALVHSRSPQFLDEGVDHRVLDVLDDSTRLVVPGERIECDVLVIKYPPCALELADDLERITVTGSVIVVMNQTPRTGYTGEQHEVYDIAAVDAEVRRVFGRRPTWIPIGPAVRQAVETHHRDELRSIDWSDDYWFELVDAEAWCRPSRPKRDDNTIVIGRHGRDSVWKWPNTANDILAAYPDDPCFRVEILGGAATAKRLLKRLPANWVVHDFGSIDTREFLHGLDVFVYYPHPDMTEGFGRTILEALAAGVPVVTDQRFTDLFGNAVVTCPVGDARAAVERIVRNETEYSEQVRRGSAVVAERFDIARHHDRLLSQGLRR